MSQLHPYRCRRPTRPRLSSLWAPRKKMKNVNDIALFCIRLEFYDNIEEQDALHGVEDVQLHPRCSLQSREDQHDRNRSVRELRVKSEE